MLDRDVVREFMKEELSDLNISIPEDIPEDALVEDFCIFTEEDYYEWLKDNFKTFFNHGEPDWNWIRDRVKKYQKIK